MEKRKALLTAAALVVTVTFAVPRASAAPAGDSANDPSAKCIKIPPGFGIDCLAAQGIGAVSKACTEGTGEAAIAACTKEIETGAGEAKIWAHMYRAFAQGKPKRYDLAVEDFSAALTAKPDLFLALIGRGMAYIMLKKPDLARADVERASALQPNNFMPYLVLCALDAAAGDEDAAKRDAQQVMSVKPENAEVYALRGEVFARALQRDALALKDFSQAIVLDPSNARALIGRSYVYAKRGQSDLALDDCRQIPPSNENEKNIHYCFGFAYEMGKRYDKALEEYGKSLALEPEDAVTLQNRGTIYLLTERFAEAVQDFDRAIALEPDQVDYYTNRGVAHRHLGRDDLAIADYSKAIELKPGNPEAYVNRGVVYIAAKDFDRALADFERALELKPGDPNILHAIDMAKRKVVPPLKMRTQGETR